MFTRLLRRLFPSVPVLARTPLAGILDRADALIKRRHPEWVHLPPASLRMRIGVGNRILRNHREFIAEPEGRVRDLERRGYIQPGARILELGCGCGRNAIALARYLNEDGRYTGQDVDAEMIAWCAEHLANDRFRFEHADILSHVYNPGGRKLADYRFPCEDADVSFILSVSVFSHLLYEDARHYVRECARVLERGGRLHMTAFVMDFLAERLGSRWSFAHREDRCYIENRRYPEAAVAYDLAVLEEIFEECGLALETIYDQDRHQATLIVRKP